MFSILYVLEKSRFGKDNDSNLLQLENIPSIVLLNDEPVKLDKSINFKFLKLLKKYEKLVI